MTNSIPKIVILVLLDLTKCQKSTGIIIRFI